MDSTGGMQPELRGLWVGRDGVYLWKDGVKYRVPEESTGYFAYGKVVAVDCKGKKVVTPCHVTLDAPYGQ